MKFRMTARSLITGMAAGLVLAMGLASTSLAADPTAAAGGEPISTAPGAAALVAMAPDPTSAQIDAWLKSDAPPVQTPDAQPLALTEQPLQRAVHGEAGAYVSNRGYGGYEAAAMPIGQASELDLAVAGSHERLPWGGTANPKSIAVGLYLDGGDVARMISRSKCGVPRWGVSLPGDPKVNPDGSCTRTDATAEAAPKAHSHGRGTPQ